MDDILRGTSSCLQYDVLTLLLDIVDKTVLVLLYHRLPSTGSVLIPPEVIEEVDVKEEMRLLWRFVLWNLLCITTAPRSEMSLDLGV